ncbi:ImmA/IrrE family metallo-endopeptidase [Kitasatospora sp. NBC_00039]|uniref:ImmA/IrrE family metallo-endopeptidase n=1 Tax=Kitasatospora sp. NBC_00039 TaxID=2903565 RepID=UPI00324CB50D
MSEDLQVQPGMLALLRESRGLTQAELARAMTKASVDGSTPVSQGYVSRAEKGQLTVTGERLELYAAALGYPAELLAVDPEVAGVGVGLVHHRKRASLSAPALRRIHAQLGLTRYQVSRLEELAGRRPSQLSVPRIEVDDELSPRDAAREVRRLWSLQPGPVDNLILVLEEAGCLVVTVDLDSDLLDAASQWPKGQDPLLLLNSRAPGGRCRFSVAHELGHLVMHGTPGAGTKQEKEADAFASEFLMPAADIRSAFKSQVDLARLAGLKSVWKVSMAALLRRAFQLGALSEWNYRTLTIEMSALGYRTAEPVEIAREQPGRVPDVVRRLLGECGMNIAEAAACARLLPEDFQRLYVEAACMSSLSPSLKVRP